MNELYFVIQKLKFGSVKPEKSFIINLHTILQFFYFKYAFDNRLWMYFIDQNKTTRNYISLMRMPNYI